MTVIGGRVQALHKIESKRRIDQEAENASTNKIPEQHRRKEHERPAIIGFPLRVPFDLGVAIGFESDNHKRHDFERGKCSARCDDRNRCSGEIHMMESPQHPAKQENDRGKEHHHRCCRCANEAHVNEQQRNDCGGEHLEDAFDPQVNNPPAPIFGQHQVRFLAPHQTGGIEEADCNDRNDDEENDGAAVRLAQSRPKRPENEDDPQQQSDRKIDLPDASQVDILPSLMTKPVVGVEVRDEAVAPRPTVRRNRQRQLRTG